MHEVVREIEMRPGLFDSTGLSDSHEEPERSDVLVMNELPTSPESSGVSSKLILGLAQVARNDRRNRFD